MRVARGVAIGYLLAVLIMTMLERRLVYPAPPPVRSDWAPAGVRFEEVEFASADGTPLHGWFFPRVGARRAVLYCHGNGEQVADNTQLMTLLRDRLDAQVFIFDYRGYGRSGGKPDEPGVVADTLAAQRWLAERTGRTPADTILVGRSIGGGAAVAAAAEQGAKALVLQSTFTRLTDAAAHQFPWLPVRWAMSNRYDSLERIARYRGPLLQSHGTADRVVPFGLGEALFAAAPAPDKEFFTIEGGGHNDPQPRDYYRALMGFLDRVDPPPAE